MKLNNILQGIDIVAADGDLGREISSLTFDSRTCAPGCLFIAVPGTAVDGHSFIAKAVEAGASAVIAGVQSGANVDTDDGKLYLTKYLSALSTAAQFA